MEEPATKSTPDTDTEGDVTPKLETNSEAPHKSASKNCTSVRDYGVACDQNFKCRRRMEDAHYLEDGFNGDPHSGFFGVYDGHGGKEAAIFASKHFHNVLAEEINKDPTCRSDGDKMKEVMRTVYLGVDEKMKDAVPSHHGCTSVTCLITGTGDDRHLFTANAGDARAVLCRDGKAIRLTEEHKAEDPVEAQRIKDAGGFIANGRVNGQIIITRSLGDHMMKDYILGDPYYQYEKLSDKDTILIVACDGLWDVCEDQAAIDFLLGFPNANCDELSKRLMIKALQDGSTDNLSVCVVKL